MGRGGGEEARGFDIWFKRKSIRSASLLWVGGWVGVFVVVVVKHIGEIFVWFTVYFLVFEVLPRMGRVRVTTGRWGGGGGGTAGLVIHKKLHAQVFVTRQFFYSVLPFCSV